MANRQSQSIKTLLQKNKQLPPEELDILLALALGKNKEYVYKNPEKELRRSTIKAFYKLLNKRLANWSLAYLRGYKEFYGLKFLVSKHTLIPRPESELLVEEALKFIKPNHKIIDLGTGSGCLILSVAKNFPQAEYLATDISKPALKTAQTNSRKLGLKNKIKFINSNLLKSVPKTKFDIVIANLPYLKPDELKESSIKKEPTSALLSGQDGLDHYKKLLHQITAYLADQYLILLEINPQQAELIKKAIVSNLPKAQIKFLKDLTGNIRVVKITN